MHRRCCCRGLDRGRAGKRASRLLRAGKGAAATCRTITITSGSQRLSMLNVARNGVARRRIGVGDQMFVSAPVSTDGGAHGMVRGVFTVGNARTVRIERTSGLLGSSTT
jgi:hypothetical protein